MRGSLICVSTLNFVISDLLKLGAAAVKTTLKSEGHQFNQYVTIKQNIVSIGRVNKIPTMQFFAGISRNTQSRLYMLSLTECVWDFQNNALWDTH